MAGTWALPTDEEGREIIRRAHRESRRALALAVVILVGGLTMGILALSTPAVWNPWMFGLLLLIGLAVAPGLFASIVLTHSGLMPAHFTEEGLVAESALITRLRGREPELLPYRGMESGWWWTAEDEPRMGGGLTLIYRTDGRPRFAMLLEGYNFLSAVQTVRRLEERGVRVVRRHSGSL